MDAYCLLEIFEFFVKRTRELRLDYDLTKAIGKKFKTSILATQRGLAGQADSVLEDSTQSNNQDNVESKEQMKEALKPDSTGIVVVNEEPIKPEDLRVICKWDKKRFSFNRTVC